MLTEGMGFDYIYENNTFIIKNKKGILQLNAPISECELLYYNPNELFGTGELVIYHSSNKKPLIDHYNKKFRDIYNNFYNEIKDSCILRNLSKIDAENYRGIEKQEKKEQTRETAEAKKTENHAKIKQEWSDRTAKQKAEIAAKKHEKDMIKKQYQKLIEFECTCQRCKKVFYYDNMELLNNAARKLYAVSSMLGGRGATGVIVSGQTKDLDKCPNCGSKAIIKVEKEIWLDKEGNVVEMQ